MRITCRYMLLCLLNLEIKIFCCTKNIGTKFYESVGKRFTPSTGSSTKQVNLKTRSQDWLVECFQHDPCKSFNVFKDDRTGKLLCDMYDTTIGSVTNDHKFTYFSEEEEQISPQRSSNPATTETPEKACKGSEAVEVNKNFLVSMNDTKCLKIRNDSNEIILIWGENTCPGRKFRFTDNTRIVTYYISIQYCIHATQNNFVCLKTPNSACQEFAVNICGLFRQIKLRNEPKCIGFNDEKEVPSVSCNENLVYNITWL